MAVQIFAWLEVEMTTNLSNVKWSGQKDEVLPVLAEQISSLQTTADLGVKCYGQGVGGILVLVEQICAWQELATYGIKWCGLYSIVTGYIDNPYKEAMMGHKILGTFALRLRGGCNEDDGRADDNDENQNQDKLSRLMI